ncbi:MAG: hypothetical protein ABJF56_03385 [Maribacter dokdonensis]|uniref:hypothetical protein n=1 Tax=Maribacter dokdonensis TaxID=320912 RepID=UPI0032668554
MITKLWKGILNNLYLILLSVSLIYFVVYAVLIFDDNYLSNWDKKVFWLDFFKNIALLIFSAGIFTASLKYLQYIKVFESEFERILLSKKFSDKIKDSVESITFSEEFLLKQANLGEIWETVTLSKYKQQFPGLYANLKKNINNTFFIKNNISYYYKHTKKTYNISVISEFLIRIEETTVFTIVRPNTDEFEWDFNVSLEEKNSEDKKYPEVEIIPLKDYGTEFDPKNNVENIIKDELLIKNCKITLSGHEVYNIKRIINTHQDLKVDREWVFGSDRIMDHLDVRVKYSNDLNVIFSSSNNVKFINEDLTESNEISYISQDLMLPGEKFKLFFLKV